MTSCICAGLSWGDLKLVCRRRRLLIPRDPLNVPPPPPDPSEDIDPVLDQEDTPIWYTHKRDKQTGLFFANVHPVASQFYISNIKKKNATLGTRVSARLDQWNTKRCPGERRRRSLHDNFSVFSFGFRGNDAANVGGDLALNVCLSAQLI